MTRRGHEGSPKQVQHRCVGAVYTATRCPTPDMGNTRAHSSIRENRYTDTDYITRFVFVVDTGDTRSPRAFLRCLRRLQCLQRLLLRLLLFRGSLRVRGRR